MERRVVAVDLFLFVLWAAGAGEEMRGRGLRLERKDFVRLVVRWKKKIDASNFMDRRFPVRAYKPSFAFYLCCRL